jgi:hypothetical protein
MLRDTVMNILKKHNIANLAREEIASEVVAAIEGARPASDEWKRICAAHESREQAEKVMLDRLEKVLGITPNSRPEWVSIARFLIEKESDAETIETFASNCKLDPYNTPKKHQIAKDPMQIKANWKHVIAISTPKDYTAGLPAEDPPTETVEDVQLTTIEEAWQSALDQLDMNNGTFEKWMKDTRPLGWENGIFLVGVPTDYAREWLTQRLASTVQRLLCGILNTNVKVEFVLTEGWAVKE